MHRTSFATLGLMVFTLTIYLHYLFMRKPSPVWQLFSLEWHSRWSLYKTVKRSSRLLTSPVPITSHTNQVSISSSGSSGFAKLYRLQWLRTCLFEVVFKPTAPRRCNLTTVIFTATVNLDIPLTINSTCSAV